MAVTLHEHLPLEIKVDIMRRLPIRDRQAYATVFRDLIPVYRDDIHPLLDKAMEEFERRVLDSSCSVRITLAMKAWSAGRFHRCQILYPGWPDNLFYVYDIAGMGSTGQSYLDRKSMMAYFRPFVLESVTTGFPIRIGPLR